LAQSKSAEKFDSEN